MAEFRNLRARFYREQWGKAAHSVGAEFEELGQGYLRMSRGGCRTIVHMSKVQLDDHLTLEIAGNKPLTNRLLAEYGHPVPRFMEFDISKLGRAERFASELGAAVVVKPARGTGGGMGVTMGIETRRQLRRAAVKADSYRAALMIEEQVPGSSYRLLYLNGEFIDAVRRDPPSVIGDGTSSVKALIGEENTRRLTSDSVTALSPLTIDLEVNSTLSAQGLSLRSVPKCGTSILVKGVVNQNAARDNHSVRDEVHPSIVQLGQNVVQRFNIELGGLDLLTTDVGVPLDDTNGVINEVNTTPGLHHHMLVAKVGAGPPVTELILEYMFDRTLGTRQESSARYPKAQP